MADEIKLMNAKKVYNTLCSALESRNWNFQKNEENLIVHFGVNGDDLPINLVLGVDAERSLIICYSKLPATMPEDKRVDGALAVCVANYGMVNGGFDYDLAEGDISFRLVTSYRGCTVGEDLFNYIIDCTCSTVDVYNDKFFMLAKGMVDIQGFLKSVD